MSLSQYMHQYKNKGIEKIDKPQRFAECQGNNPVLVLLLRPLSCMRYTKGNEITLHCLAMAMGTRQQIQLQRKNKV